MSRPLIALTALMALLPGSLFMLTSASAEPRPAQQAQTDQRRPDESHAEKQAVDKKAIQIRVYGQLQDDVVAIGGETTGTTVTAQNMTFELVLSPELKRLAAEHRGEPVLVEGTLRVQQGVEIPQRLMLHAKKLRYGRPGPNEMPHAVVTLRGKLQTGVAAIGGETTGTQVTAQAATWELDLQGKKDLTEQADRLAGKQVVVEGKLSKTAGVERPDRYVIETTRLEPAPR